jgi:hypothetical protein
MVRFEELATPLTQKRYVRTPDGAMYGLEMTGARMTSTALHLHTVAGLSLRAGRHGAGCGQPSWAD